MSDMRNQKSLIKAAKALGWILGVLGTLIFVLGVVLLVETSHLALAVCSMLLGAIPVVMAYPAFCIVMRSGDREE